MIKFRLRDGLKWSNGQSILASEVCKSFERAKSKYYDELHSLFDVVKEIRCSGDRIVEFETNVNILDSNILRKLTEPMYGIVDTNRDGSLSLKRSSGPFVIEKSSSSEIVLKKNLNWHKSHAEVANRVELRQQSDIKNPVTEFTNDSWVNLLTTNSLQSNSVIEDFKRKNFELWQRSFDKVFFLSPSKAFVSEFGTKALKSLARSIKTDSLLPKISGFQPTEQFFPRGYVLHDPSFNSSEEVKVPKLNKSLRLLLPLTPSGVAVKDTLPLEIERLTGKKPVVLLIKPNEISEAKAKGDYDILAVNVAVDDPNYEGAMAFFFAGNAPLIGSGTGDKNYVGRIAKSKTLKTDEERVKEMRAIISEATQEGYVIPLFHFASLTVAKKGIDLSKIPLTKETIPFSQIRFR